MAWLALCHVVLSIWATKSTASLEASLRASKEWPGGMNCSFLLVTAQLSTLGKTHKSLNIYTYTYMNMWIYDQNDHIISGPALHIHKSTKNTCRYCKIHILNQHSSTYIIAPEALKTHSVVESDGHTILGMRWIGPCLPRALLNHYVSLQGCSKMSQLASPVCWSALNMQYWCPSSYLLYIQSLPFSASLSSSSSSRTCMNGACTCFSTSKFNVPDAGVALSYPFQQPKLAKYLTWPTMTCKLHQCREMERSFRHRQIYNQWNLGIDHKSLALEKKKARRNRL